MNKSDSEIYTISKKIICISIIYKNEEIYDKR